MTSVAAVAAGQAVSCLLQAMRSLSPHTPLQWVWVVRLTPMVRIVPVTQAGTPRPSGILQLAVALGATTISMRRCKTAVRAAVAVQVQLRAESQARELPDRAMLVARGAIKRLAQPIALAVVAAVLREQAQTPTRQVWVTGVMAAPATPLRLADLPPLTVVVVLAVLIQVARQEVRAVPGEVALVAIQPRQQGTALMALGEAAAVLVLPLARQVQGDLAL